MAPAKRSPAAGKSSRTGRRPGHQDTRSEILTAAREVFASKGFAGTTVRAIAGAADVDASLVHHYFGSKDQLFLATVEMPVDVPAMVEEILSDGVDGIGTRLVRTILQAWESALQPAMVASLRAMISDPESTRGMREFLTLEVIGRIVTRLDLPEAEANRRAGLVASQVIGLFTGRYLLQLPSLTSQSVDELVSALGPTIQNYLSDSRLKGS